MLEGHASRVPRGLYGLTVGLGEGGVPVEYVPTARSARVVDA